MSGPPPPPGLNIYEDVKWTVISPVIILVSIASIAVALRIISKTTSSLQLQWDDYLIVLALVFAYGTAFLTIMSAVHGIGKHIWNPTVDLVTIVKVLWAFEFMYDSVIPAIKMSIVVFYWRVFAIRSFRMVLYFVTFLVMGWWFSILIVACVQCRPYSYFWNQYVDPTAKGTCINTYYFFIGNGAASVITDFIILICPIPMVWKLQMPIAQRLSVISIFLLGGFVCVAGIVRIYFLTFIDKDADLTWNMAQSFVWSSVEPCIGIVSACLPTLRPLLRRFFPRWFDRSKTPGSKPTYGNSTAGKLSRNQDGDFYRLDDSRNFRSKRDDEVRLTNDIGASGSHPPDSAEDVDASYMAISVKRDIEWNESHAV